MGRKERRTTDVVSRKVREAMIDKEPIELLVGSTEQSFWIVPLPGSKFLLALTGSASMVWAGEPLDRLDLILNGFGFTASGEIVELLTRVLNPIEQPTLDK